jgi:hypothetical protein
MRHVRMFSSMGLFANCQGEPETMFGVGIALPLSIKIKAGQAFKRLGESQIVRAELFGLPDRGEQRRLSPGMFALSPGLRGHLDFPPPCLRHLRGGFCGRRDCRHQPNRNKCQHGRAPTQ